MRRLTTAYIVRMLTNSNGVIFKRTNNPNHVTFLTNHPIPINAEYPFLYGFGLVPKDCVVRVNLSLSNALSGFDFLPSVSSFEQKMKRFGDVEPDLLFCK
jgi:hypothetical protein